MASDIFIVQNCDFLNCLQFHDEVMADRVFKIQDMRSVLFPLPRPSIPICKWLLEMSGTSKITNVRIYVSK